MEIIEKVARALFDVEWKDHACQREFDQSRDYWLESARAAIAAYNPDERLREALEEIAAGVACDRDHWSAAIARSALSPLPKGDDT